MRRLKTIGVLMAAGVLAAACGSSSPSSSGSTGTSSAPSGVLTIDNESGGTWTCDFNPFNLSYISFSLGNVYEPLVFVNALQNAQATPWLATSWTWGSGNTTLTFTIRNGVKFSNGNPMTAADVVFTFNMLKRFKTLDINSVWSVLSGVTQKGSDQVVMTFKTAAVPYFYYIADQIGIVDQSVWSKVANPVNYPDKNPVGTGAFKVGNCTPQNIKYVANTHYWQPGLPKVGTVNYPAFLTNDTANTYLANGQAQWGSQFIPSIQKFYLNRNPNYHYWFPPVANVSLFVNLTNPLLKNLAVRQAIAYGIDRQKASTIGEYGYEPASNQSGIVTPTFSSWENTSQAAAFGNNYAYDPQKAISILEHAGFKKGSNGIFQSPSGKPLSFNVVNNGGFSDWVAAMQTIQQSLKAIGIQLNPENVAYSTWQSDIYTGKFDLGYYAETGGPSPYYELRQWLYSANSAPIGTAAGSNFERYSNPAVDALINQYATTTSAATQHSIVDQLQKVMLTDVPVIPVTEQVDWFQYDTGSFSGWPTPGNPYAQPAAYNYPDWGQLMLHLTPAK
ncbi:MAG TPA: ABC transporter substrate-binding protein [Streptosporangiaceae bacterium]|nr:ABC transporter substrate-binding protein [Streptosporangiaceae bacterium]